MPESQIDIRINAIVLYEGKLKKNKQTKYFSAKSSKMAS